MSEKISTATPLKPYFIRYLLLFAAFQIMAIVIANMSEFFDNLFSTVIAAPMLASGAVAHQFKIKEGRAPSAIEVRRLTRVSMLPVAVIQFLGLIWVFINLSNEPEPAPAAFMITLVAFTLFVIGSAYLIVSLAYNDFKLRRSKASG